ncbi:MAG: tRNA (adenosine(37)-N6)-dimethylallyltransferase MiaA [Deltaproteobacteria bacterium]|nr:tRNA (adenosine(37)-N6)-dimethylallyltransferase MiaA [Deltaproteobacteria bacterium]
MTTVDDIPAPEPDEIITVVGPTASGKTGLAIALAERWGGEIIGADSVQIYRLFDVGSGKPTAAERAQVPHHLIDVVDPLAPFDAGRFVAMADEAIAEVRSRGRRPIVCGGTFLWVKALLFGLAPSAPADDEIRARHAAIAEQAGRPALHERLAQVDPTSAARLAPNDLVRVSRALEVFELTGKTQSEWHAEHQFGTSRYRTRLLGVERPRDVIDRRIAERAQGWLDGDWITEVRDLLDGGYGEARAMASVGYKQVRDHVLGELGTDELQEAVVRATRKFVRRQRTWLRDEPVDWVSP